MTDPDARARGAAKMSEVYDFPFTVGDAPGDFYTLTVEHLFGDIWCREGLSVPDRRLLTIGVLAALGRGDLLEIQFASALGRGELTPEALREVVVHLAHYVGWPNGATVNEAAEKVIARRAKAAAKAAAEGGGASDATDAGEPV